MTTEAIIAQGLQIVVFSLTEEASKKRMDYGVSIEQVQEIGIVEDISRVPNAPAYVRGVMNLRGKIITIIDVKEKLGFASSKDVKSTSRILVAEVGSVLTGLLVDEVDQVMRISQDDVEASPAAISESAPYIRGIAKTQGRLIVLIDLQKLLGDEKIEGGK